MKKKIFQLFPLKDSWGFTLLEIMIAVFILAIVMTIVLGSFNTIYMNSETIYSSADDYEMAKTCMDRITFDLQSIHITSSSQYKAPSILEENLDPNRILSETIYIDANPFSKIRFASRAHISLDKSPGEGIAEIVYYIHKTDDERFVLRRKDRILPNKDEDFEEKNSDPVLCEKLKSFAIKFIDDESSEQESWDSESGMFGYSTPRALIIEFEFEEESSVPFLRTMIKLPVYRDKIGI